MLVEPTLCGIPSAHLVGVVVTGDADIVTTVGDLKRCEPGIRQLLAQCLNQTRTSIGHQLGCVLASVHQGLLIERCRDWMIANVGVGLVDIDELIESQYSQRYD